jgi:hypothetical protein
VVFLLALMRVTVRAMVALRGVLQCVVVRAVYVKSLS